MQPLSTRQREVFDFIVQHVQTSGGFPSFREIGDALGIRSTNGVSDHLRVLETKGYIERFGARGTARSYRVCPAIRAAEPEVEVERELVHIPLVGNIAAGQPLEAIVQSETVLKLDASLLSSAKEVFALTIRGESMVGDGIFDGDVVFIKRADACRNGVIAAVQVDGEATLKHVFHEPGRLRLESSNPAFSPIHVSAANGDCRILGTLAGVFRRVS